METFILKDISLSGWAFGDSNDVLDILAGDNWILNDFFAIWKEVSYLNNIRIVCFWEHDWYLVTSLFVFLILCIVFLKIYLFLGLFISGAQLSGAQFATFGGRTVGPRTTGPRGPIVRGPICHFWGADNWAPDSCPGPNCPGPDCPGPNLPRTIGGWWSSSLGLLWKVSGQLGPLGNPSIRLSVLLMIGRMWG